MSVFADITLDPGSVIIWMVVGIIAGWLAGLMMKGGGYGLVGDMIVGLIGAVIGGSLFGLLGVGSGGLPSTIAIAFIGACILIAVLRFVAPVRTRL
jgi:uncharacterized membrane protein YeaQ/YmgE (transglycosylase-associated protein family)